MTEATQGGVPSQSRGGVDKNFDLHNDASELSSTPNKQEEEKEEKTYLISMVSTCPAEHASLMQHEFLPFAFWRTYTNHRHRIHRPRKRPKITIFLIFAP